MQISKTIAAVNDSELPHGSAEVQQQVMIVSSGARELVGSVARSLKQLTT